jgi:hypothetical protein
MVQLPSLRSISEILANCFNGAGQAEKTVSIYKVAKFHEFLVKKEGERD